eukprot:COSAG01_NODE_9659_length_2377_cov_8.310360_2_plen_134_part_00
MQTPRGRLRQRWSWRTQGRRLAAAAAGAASCEHIRDEKIAVTRPVHPVVPSQATVLLPALIGAAGQGGEGGGLCSLTDTDSLSLGCCLALRAARAAPLDSDTCRHTFQGLKNSYTSSGRQVRYNIDELMSMGG